MHMCMYVCIYVYTCMCMYIYTYIGGANGCKMYVGKYIYMYIYIHIFYIGGANGCKIYVGNLSWEVKWQDLKGNLSIYDSHYLLF
jgi:hypothetical protein